MPRVFISYDRADAVALAGRIYDRLRAKYGEASIFIDLASIPLGAKWGSPIEEAISRAEAFVAVIGPHWMSRVMEPDSYVRHEVEVALMRQIRIIPLLLATPMPRRDELPSSLHDLCSWQAMEVTPGADFHHQMDRLIASLESMPPREGAGEQRPTMPST